MQKLLKELGTTGLGLAFARQALATPERVALLDSTGQTLRYGELLSRALALAARLEGALGPVAGEPRVGVVLPPGVAGALANVALALSRRASVNLNAVSGPVALREQMQRADLRHVILSRAAFEALGGAAVFEQRALFLEDLLAGLADAELPTSADLDVQPEDGARIATVLFSSGSTARAKAIQLTHANVLSNARAVAQAFEMTPDDRLLGVLPFFHSFGYTVTLWAPVCGGASTAFHRDPLDARAVGELARAHRPTILIATPVLCQAWMRRIEPEALRSLRFAIVGAQRLAATLEQAWFARYGLHLHEGYGCTELAPVVSANLPDRPELARRKPGSVGRPIPGVEVEVRDPETGARLPAGTEGDVWVKSAGVMAGYLGDEAATRKVVVGGWYDTQDVGRLDSDGFLTLTDRRSRFSKLGGEMVSHGAVESALQLAAVALGESPEKLGIAVTALADEQKGERLCVLHTPLSAGIEAVLERARADGLANLFTPRASDCFAVEALPYLASGKLDLATLKRWAEEQRGAARQRSTEPGSTANF